MYTAYANYIIYFTNAAEYAAAVAYCGGTGYGHCPRTAALRFGIPWPLVGGGILQSKGLIGYAPYGIPASPGAGVEIGHPEPSGVFIKSDIDSFVVPGQFGNPPGALAGPDMTLVWWGQIIKVNIPVTTTPIPERRFIGGLELGDVGAEGGSGFTGEEGSRNASRTLDGLGLIIRGTHHSPLWLRNQNQFVTGLTKRETWERFYVRVNALGTNECGIWRGRSSTNPAAGAGIKINNATGCLEAWTITNGAVATLRATSVAALTLDKWYLIDVLIRFPAAAADYGRIRVYSNHSLVLDYTDTSGGSLDTVGYHATSELGQWTTNDAVWSVDLDDWIGADIPNNGGVESLDSLDWLLGSHVRAFKVNSLTGSANWTGGSVETCNQGFNPDCTLNSHFVSATALATIEAVSDVSDIQSYAGVVVGPVAVCFSAFTGAAVGSPASRLGYKIAGAATVWEATIDAVNHAWRHILYRPSGLITPTTIAPLSVLKEKSNDVVSTEVYALGGVVEYIGIWGQEDEPLSVDLSNQNKYFHNARFANTTWGTVLGPPTAPCYAVGGTYVGTGTTLHVDLPAPAHFIWIRGLTGAASGVKSFGAGLGGNQAGSDRLPPNYITRSWVDSTGQAKFSLTGTDAENNAVGVVYQYVAFCDPGMRFNYCGTYTPNPTDTDVDISLFVTTFLAECGFIQRERIISTTNTTILSYKGPGDAGVTGHLVDGTAKANWGEFAAGILTYRADNVISAQSQTNFSLWRTTDPDCLDVACQITSYVGDGAANKTIALPLVTGRYPLFVMVLPHGATGYFRDPSHAGANSRTIVGLINSITAIKGGGVDEISVGITLNGNGITYEVFVIMGDSASWSNGEFYVPDCIAKGPWVAGTFAPTQDFSGIYTLVPGKLTDSMYDKIGGQPSIEMAIPDPEFKTGYIGG
jgi:hypothetical protein